jgi:predicted phage terminase large subunit-like protein
MASKLTADIVSVAVDRELCRRSFHEFVKRAWHIIEPGVPFSDNWHIELVCRKLEAVFRGEIKKLVINQPPGTSKSTVVSVLFKVWTWINQPGHKFLAASFDGSLTLRDARKCLTLLQSDWFKARWGDTVAAVEKNLAVSDFATTAGGQLFSTSVGGKVTGRHFDTHIIDDPTKPLAVSPVTLEQAQKWFQGTLASRFRDPKNGRTVLIMQRLHENDLAGFLEREHGYYVVRLPMEYEPAEAHPEDPRTEEGELLWPDRIPLHVVLELKKTMGSIVYAAQEQQRPVPEGGAVFRREWFQYYKGVPAKFDQLLMSVDCSFKDLETSDWVVIQVWGRRGGEFWLLDQTRERMGFSATCVAIRAMAKKWPRAVKKIVEDKANGSAVVETLNKKISGMRPVNPEGGKLARANAVSPLFEAKNVWLPDPELAPWIGDYTKELQSFPMGTNDDQVDATTQALNHMYMGKSRVKEAMAAMARGYMPGIR